MPDIESIKNILMALYESSGTVKTYVDTVASGRPIPFTILTKSIGNEINEEIVKRLHIKQLELQETLKQCREDSVEDMLDLVNEMLDEEFVLEEDAKYEVIMFRGDAVVEGSRQIVSDPLRIKQMREYAKAKGYEFSARKIDD